MQLPLEGIGGRRFEAEEAVEVLEEQVRWRARDAAYLAGRWPALSKRVPTFVTQDFKAVADGPGNPHLRSVVRRPLTPAEKPVAVGVVSHTYQLAQHTEVVEKCFQALEEHRVKTEKLRCELGLTPLGEWMNFRAYFPESFSHKPADGNPLTLRLECFNSVDGSSRLVILLGWFRFICTNGLVIGETKAALRDIHDEHLNLHAIPRIISEGLDKVKADLVRLRRWESIEVALPAVQVWVDGSLAAAWGKKAACRTLHICRSGADVEILDPFAGGKPSEKPTQHLCDVPGAAKPAKNLYDVCQALSWVASHRANAEERLERQEDIPKLIGNLRKHA